MWILNQECRFPQKERKKKKNTVKKRKKTNVDSKMLEVLFNRRVWQ
jgi:hypothetical protein